MELFILKEDYLVDLNKPWISTILEFKKILLRDKDRYKKRAMKEFTFIYHYTDFKSHYREYSDEERLKESIRNAQLEEDFKLEKDSDLVAAIERYKTLRDTRALKIIRAAFRAVDSVTEYFNTLTIVDADAAKNLMVTIGGMSKTLASLSEMEKQVMNELTEEQGIRGNSLKGLREDPNERTS